MGLLVPTVRWPWVEAWRWRQDYVDVAESNQAASKAEKEMTDAPKDEAFRAGVQMNIGYIAGLAGRALDQVDVLEAAGVPDCSDLRRILRELIDAVLKCHMAVEEFAAGPQEEEER